MCGIFIDTEEGQTQLEETMSMKKPQIFSETRFEGSGE